MTRDAIQSRASKLENKRRSMRRAGRSHLTREMFLPLPTEKIHALSLENHLALATVRGGRGDLDQVICLVRVVYLAFYLRDATSTGTDLDLYRRAEAALNACVTRVDRGSAACCSITNWRSSSRSSSSMTSSWPPSRGIATWTLGSNCDTTSRTENARQSQPQRACDPIDREGIVCI